MKKPPLLHRQTAAAAITPEVCVALTALCGKKIDVKILEGGKVQILSEPGRFSYDAVLQQYHIQFKDGSFFTVPMKDFKEQAEKALAQLTDAQKKAQG